MAGDVNQSLREALFEALTGILSPHHNARVVAEEQLKALEVTEEYGIHLTEFTIDPLFVAPVRQLASVLLKQYVETHWSLLSEKFSPPEVQATAKEKIREILPQGLKEPLSKVRSSVAYAVAAIAQWDWPEQWPSLFEILMSCLTAGDHNAVHGAMRVLTEFCRDLTDTQIPHVAPFVLPEMYRIFCEQEKYEIRTRGRAVEIFSTLASVICTMGDYKKGSVKTLLQPILPSFTEALVHGLQVPDGNLSDSGLKMEILKALTLLVKHIPKQMSQWLPEIVTPVWQTLTQSANIYVQTVVNNVEAPVEAVDSDGEVLGFENLVYSIFEFVHTLIDTPKLQSTLKQAMADLMYYIILYMQMTEEQVQAWTENPDQFVEDEDEDGFTYSVRISAQDLLLALCYELRDESSVGLVSAVSRHLHESQTRTNIGWWKVHESCLLALGSVRDLVLEKSQKREIAFNLVEFIENVVIPDLKSPGVSPFLLGRCVWFGSRYPHAMSQSMVHHFLEATISALHESQPHSVRVAAVRSVYGFCDILKENGMRELLCPFLPSIVDGLLSLTEQFSTEVLSLVLESLEMVITVDPGFTASIESKLTPLIIAIFLKHSSDPLIIPQVEEIFSELSRNAQCLAPLQMRLVPTLVSILNTPADKIPAGMQATVLDILQTVIRSSTAPLSESLINDAFPSAVHCTLQTDDYTTMQSGGECIRSYVSVSPEQVYNFTDSHGHTGLEYTIQVCKHLLSPTLSESSASFVGRLVTLVIQKLGSRLGERLDVLLRAVLSKLQGTETLTVQQSLVLVYAHLVNSQMEAVLSFLSTVPGPTGKSALHFVLTEWAAKQHLFYGTYDCKVSIIALCKLLQHGITTNDGRLVEIIVNGDQVVPPDAGGVRTRSQQMKQPVQWTTIPLLVKLFKLLINELSNVMETNMAAATDDDTDDSDEDEEKNDIENMPRSDNISELLKLKSGEMFDDVLVDEDDDPDAASDPISTMNLQEYLTSFLQELSQQPCFPHFQPHLNPQERQVLATIGVAT